MIRSTEKWRIATGVPLVVLTPGLTMCTWDWDWSGESGEIGIQRNHEGVMGYLEECVESNKKYENLYRWHAGAR